MADFRVGEIRRPVSGRVLGSCWAQGPLAPVKKVVAGGRLLVGWSSARVEALRERPLQCFRCLETGHTRATCKSAVDRGTLCYRCGAAEHRASAC